MFWQAMMYRTAFPRNDNEWEKEFIEKVGVKINWEEIPAGSDANQAYNLMIVGADLPDIFYYWGVPALPLS